MDHVVPVVTLGPASRRGRLAGLLIGLYGALGVPAGESLAQVVQQSLFTSPEPPEWAESQVVLPKELPAESALAPFTVSSAATASFLVDTSSVTRGDDGIWRFVLVIRTAGGAENITYEGIRCATAERRLYAIGRRGEGWTASRNDTWTRIAENTLNRYHAALFKDYFCPPGAAQPSLAEAVTRLRRGAPILPSGNPTP